jgi:AcrR family transcriptional regulator
MGSEAAGPPDRGPLEIKTFPRDIVAPSERERLVAAMAESCAERGYTQTSAEEVAARAGLPLESFERHFAGKSECGLAAANQILASITATVTAPPGSSGRSDDLHGFRARLLLGVRALLELLAAQPSLATLATVEARQAMPPEVHELYVSGVRVLTAMLDRLRSYASADASAPPSAARGALGGAEALVRRELLAGRAWRLPELFPDIIYGALAPFLDQQEALRYAGLARELLNEGG